MPTEQKTQEPKPRPLTPERVQRSINFILEKTGLHHAHADMQSAADAADDKRDAERPAVD